MSDKEIKVKMYGAPVVGHVYPARDPWEALTAMNRFFETLRWGESQASIEARFRASLTASRARRAKAQRSSLTLILCLIAIALFACCSTVGFIWICIWVMQIFQ